MNILLKTRKELQAAGRWDVDFHLPALGIREFPHELLKRVDQVADVVKDKRDPSARPEEAFQYVDISAVDVTTGHIANPQDVEGSEAPSRARKVVQAFDVVVSTCRPTRGAIAVVPVKLHNQIASTAFSIVRAHANINPFYLHYALRLPSSLEQFRKWSTGSSYPAILDGDVKKTIIPVPSEKIQDAIATKVVAGLRARADKIRAANLAWDKVLDEIGSSLTGKAFAGKATLQDEGGDVFLLKEVRAKLSTLPAIVVDKAKIEELDLADLEGALSELLAKES